MLTTKLLVCSLVFCMLEICNTYLPHGGLYLQASNILRQDMWRRNMNEKMEALNRTLMDLMEEVMDGKKAPAMTAESHDMEVMNRNLVDLTEEAMSVKKEAAKIAELRLQEDIAYNVMLFEDASYADGEVFKFDNVMYNRGLGYNKSSGIFSAPVTGTYLFWAHIMRNDIHWLGVAIADSFYVGVIPEGIIHDVATISGIKHVRKGEQVWMYKEAHRVTPLRGNNLSSYGGILIRAD